MQRGLQLFLFVAFLLQAKQHNQPQLHPICEDWPMNLSLVSFRLLKDNPADIPDFSYGEKVKTNIFAAKAWKTYSCLPCRVAKTHLFQWTQWDSILEKMWTVERQIIFSYV